MLNFIAIDLRLHKKFKITRVSFFGTHCRCQVRRHVFPDDHGHSGDATGSGTPGRHLSPRNIKPLLQCLLCRIQDSLVNRNDTAYSILSNWIRYKLPKSKVYERK